MRYVLTFAAIVLFNTAFFNTANAQKVRLRAQVTPECTSANPNLKFADIYADGNIAVQGSYGCKGAFIYDITNPDAPVLASRYNPGDIQQFLEAIVIGNRAYFGSGSAGGVHIVDLSDPYHPQLLGIVNGQNGGGFNSIHEMMVINQKGVDYLIENFNGFANRSIRILNVTNPASPVLVRSITPTEVQWVHAMHIRGNRMFTSGWGNSTNRGRTEIYDITNIGTQEPALLGYIEDPTSTTAGNNMHSSWTSEDGKYLYSARETNNGTGDVRVYDITNPATPMLVRAIGMEELGLNAVTPHNPVVVGSTLYVSWYQAGLQIFNLNDPRNPVRTGQYDTFESAFAPNAAERAALLDAEPWDMICGSSFVQNTLPTTYDGLWAVYPFLGPDKILVGDLARGLLILDTTEGRLPNHVSDFDGDLSTDFSTYSPATGEWKILPRNGGQQQTFNWGVPGDVPVSGDFDGDRKVDIAVWRPSDGTWYIRRSSGGFWFTQFGQQGDVPVPADYDADGKSDIAVWRPSTGMWYIIQSTAGYKTAQWGIDGDKAFAGDHDGDGKADLVIWRPSNGYWYIIPSSTSIATYTTWGESTDIPLNADFNGDGRAEFVVYRPGNHTWYILDPVDGSIRTDQFGIDGDIPVPSDIEDGDGRSDIAVYRPSTGYWYWKSSANLGFYWREYGEQGEMPAPYYAQPH